MGLRIAPVPLNMTGKDRELVGLGSHIVNAQGDCNGCHSSSTQEEYVFGGIPHVGQRPTVVNPAVYRTPTRPFEDPGELAWNRVARSVRRELQFPLDRLKARLFAQGIEERLGLQVLQPGITQAHCNVEPLKRLGAITPLRVDGGVLVG